MNNPVYTILEDNAAYILLQDEGPWTMHPTITNSPEIIVERFAKHLNGRPLYYIDSEGQYTELLVKDGEFLDYAEPTKHFSE